MFRPCSRLVFEGQDTRYELRSFDPALTLSYKAAHTCKRQKRAWLDGDVALLAYDDWLVLELCIKVANLQVEPSSFAFASCFHLKWKDVPASLGKLYA